KEQKFTHSGLVDPATMKKVGEVSGVRAFLYGKVVDTSGESVTAVLKLVSTQTSHVLWADKIRGATEAAGKAQVTKYDAFCSQLAEKLDAQLADRNKQTVFDFSQLDKQPQEYFDAESFLDSLVVALAKSRKCTVVDRKTLDVLFKEQNLVLDGIVSQADRDRLAKIWGIDAFVYGSIRQCTEGALAGPMMAIDVVTGQVFFGQKVAGKGDEVAGRMTVEGDPAKAMGEYRQRKAKLDEILQKYRPTSRTTTAAREKMEVAAKNAAVVVQEAIKAASAEYEELVLELLPTSPEAQSIQTQIAVLKDYVSELPAITWPLLTPELLTNPTRKQLFRIVEDAVSQFNMGQVSDTLYELTLPEIRVIQPIWEEGGKKVSYEGKALSKSDCKRFLQERICDPLEKEQSFNVRSLLFGLCDFPFEQRTLEELYLSYRRLDESADAPTELTEEVRKEMQAQLLKQVKPLELREGDVVALGGCAFGRNASDWGGFLYAKFAQTDAGWRLVAVILSGDWEN
ncbi:MAG: CsgG/HfaB family protein, partial [Planctomycetota bacterium]